MADRFGPEVFTIDNKVKVLQRSNLLKTKKINATSITLNQTAPNYSIKPCVSGLHTEQSSFLKTLEYIWKEFFSLKDTFKLSQHYPTIFKQYLRDKLDLRFKNGSESDPDLTIFINEVRNGMFNQVIYDIPPHLAVGSSWVTPGIIKVEKVSGFKLKSGEFFPKNI